MRSMKVWSASDGGCSIEHEKGSHGDHHLRLLSPLPRAHSGACSPTTQSMLRSTGSVPLLIKNLIEKINKCE